jgi:hypothetical protein
VFSHPDGFYSYTEPYLIYDINSTGYTLKDILATAKEGLGAVYLPILAGLFLLFGIVFFVSAGIPAEWGAPVVIMVTTLIFIFAEWVNPIIGGMVVMVTIGAMIIRNWTG